MITPEGLPPFFLLFFSFVVCSFLMDPCGLIINCEIFAVTEVPATVHVPATLEDATEQKMSESSLHPVTATQRTDVYSTMKLDVTVDSIKLELFSGDSDLVSVTVLHS